MSSLVCERVRVSIHPVLWRERHFVQVAAVPAAFTRQNDHYRSLEALAIRAKEAYGCRACAPWQTAPSICAGATVIRPVQADALAFTIRQVDRFWGATDVGTLLPSLKVKRTVLLCLLRRLFSHHKLLGSRLAFD